MTDAIYIHVPFCDNICFYCDFKRIKYNDILVEKWLDRITSDLDRFIQGKEITTIYIGGGTPTCLTNEQLERLLSAVDKYCDCVKEYTIESNLENIDLNTILILKKHHINRISLGVQSFDDHLLKVMNRKHTGTMANEKLKLLHQEGMNNISIDLIYGFKEECIDVWKNDLRIAAENDFINHISLYSLTIEPNSVFGKKHYKTVDDDLDADMYGYAIDYLNKNGFEQYEVSNFAKSGYESMHNKVYWHYDDFYGIGIGASGKYGNVRYSINGSVNDYIEGKEKIEKIILSNKDYIEEYIMMNLRLAEGFNIREFNNKFEIKFEELFSDKLDKLFKSNLIIFEDNIIRVTRKGMFLLNDVIIEFMEVLDGREND